MTQKNAVRGRAGGGAKESGEGDERAPKPRTSELLYQAQNALASVWNDTQGSKGNLSGPQVLGEAEYHLI